MGGRRSSGHDSKPTVAEFFAGIGLMRLGLEQAGWRVVWANDIDPWKRKMYEGHFGSEDMFDGRDIRVIESKSLPKGLELATASFPCTDLSVAGKRAGLAGEHSGLFWRFAKILEGLPLQQRPRRVLLENVLGLLRLRDGVDLQACLEELSMLNRLGYHVDVVTIDARHFVPQSRPRLFIVGERDPDLHSCLSPQDVAAGRPDALRPPRLRAFIGSLRRVRWALRSMPCPPERDREVADIVEDLPGDDPRWWSQARADYLYDQMSVKSQQWTNNHRNGRSYRYGTVFRRMRHGKSTAELRSDGVAGCLRTPKGGSARQILVRAGRGQYRARLLTARECARLMGADEFVLEGISENRALYGFGDAVCASVVTWLVSHHAAFNTAAKTKPDRLDSRSGVNRVHQLIA